MIEKGQIPYYKISDEMVNLVAAIAEKVQQFPSGRTEGEETGRTEKGWQWDSAGKIVVPSYRQKGIGIFLGEHLLGRAPMPQSLEELMGQLERWLEQSPAHPLIKAGIVIYQYVMVQFFEEDNLHYGMQHGEEILTRWRKPLQRIFLVDTLQQEALIRAFEQCDLYGEVSPFLLFFLKSILEKLEEAETVPTATHPLEVASAEGVRTRERVQRLLSQMGTGTYTNRELMELVGLKHRPTFRDKYLLPAMAQGWIVMTIPDKPNSSQQRYRKNI